MASVAADADLFLNLSGGCWFWRDEYAAIPHSAFIDSDPAFTQLALAKGVPWYVDFFRRFDRLFTFGRNIGTPACPVPTTPFHWEHTWQPVCLRQRQTVQDPPRSHFTTIMNWRIKSFEDIGGNKDQEFDTVLDLPGRIRTPLELAISGPAPLELLRGHGWHCREAFPVSRTLDTYRDYVRGSLGEFSVAKHTYVRTNSGWFSDRTECYLASGAAVVQDTGFSAHLPTGEGLIAYTSLEEAVAGLEVVTCDYPRHSRAAREVAGRASRPTWFCRTSWKRPPLAARWRGEHRIGQIATLSTPVRREGADSIESLVWLLSRELTALGHEVTVFACAGSNPCGELAATLPGPYGSDGSPGNWQLCEWINLCRAVEQSGRFDVLHSHGYLWGLPLINLSRAPMVHTLHITPYEDEARLWSLYPDSCVSAITSSQWSTYSSLRPAAVIPHGVDTDQFTFRSEPEDYVCFLGRFIPGKGVLQAVEVARRLGQRLLLAGPMNDYYRQHIAPIADGRTIEYVGHLRGAERDRFLGGARALLYPLQAPEPFGLVQVETMMCGTPVVAMRIGAVPEIIDEGVTGYTAESMEAFARQVVRSFTLDRRRIRARAEERFSARRMAQEYLALYERLTSKWGQGEGSC